MPQRKPVQSNHKKKEGIPAGSLIYVGENQPQKTMVETHLYNEMTYSLQADFVHPTEGQRSWVQIRGLEDIQKIVSIAKYFSISNLSLEDVFSTNQRLKVDFYDSYIAVTLRVLEDQNTPEQQLSLFVGTDWVLSIAEKNTPLFEQLRIQLETGQTKLKKGSSSMLFHAMIDRVVDQYLVKADELELKTEELEQLVIGKSIQTNATTIHQHKIQILKLRRLTSPLRDILSSLIRSESEYVDKTTTFLLKDVHDHAQWLSEECDMLRETVSGLMEVYLSSLDTRMNAIMKVLTIISTIFIPLTFLSGLYGMNFDHIPFSSAWWGFYAILLICIFIISSMALYFRRKKWW